MCCIITTPGKKHRPALRELLAIENTNPHGGGVAWIAGGRVRFVKGLSARQVHERLGKVSGPAVAHFRWATVGGKSAALCHPFTVSQDSPLAMDGAASRVLFHNGHWSDWREWAEDTGLLESFDGPVSDSRVIAALVAMVGDSFLARIPGRFVLLDSSVGIQRFGQWEDIGDGCQYSNLNWSRGGHGDPRRGSLVEQAEFFLE